MRRLKSIAEIEAVAEVVERKAEGQVVESLRESHDRMLAEMKRYLPVLELVEQNPMTWSYYTEGTGIATANGYREAIRQAEEV